MILLLIFWLNILKSIPLLLYQDHEYHTFDDIYIALNERQVIGALIDTYSAGSSKDLFEQENLRVKKILDYSATYGVVMGNEAKKLRRCFKHYTEKVLASEIAHHIQNNTEQLQVDIFLKYTKGNDIDLRFNRLGRWLND